MKRYACYIFIPALFTLLLFASGCGDDSNPVSGQPPLTGMPNAFIKANVPDSLASLTVNYLQEGPNHNIMASSKIDKKGNFSLNMGEPSAAFLLDMINFIRPSMSSWNGDLFISDPAARFITGRFFIYEDDVTYEIIWHKKPEVKTKNILSVSYENIYCYFDKDVEMKGELRYRNSDKLIYKFNFKAKAGWNVLLRTIYSNLAEHKGVISYNNYIPAASEFHECKYLGIYSPL